ncbi:hypothetical protein HIM_04881 [Hirsutella minnesotensis 3608]|uniref:CFEM domain-containing protein n=1 Tax=Hirsutella minnesotensis 3608 TaxID=1043627 RepID=A0A0F8A5Q2_9HYPO|nr:hypothetical protein HIM_04881 [Hirsutella minnesotensis 3608]
MKYSYAFLATAASVHQASATLELLGELGQIFMGAPKFSNPKTIQQQCNSGQSSGWNFDDVPANQPVPQYKGLSLSGFDGDGEDDTTKRDHLGRRTFLKLLSCGCQSQTSSAPSIYDKKGFTIDQVQVACTTPGNLKLSYSMPNGRTCETVSQCGPQMSTIKNNQCAGANKVSFVYLNTNKLDLLAAKLGKCKVKVYKIIWNCNSQPGQTVTQPGQTVTQPGQTVTQPGESVTQPGQTVTQPGQTVTQPGQTVTQPGQTVTQPGESVTQPGQTVTQPGQTVTQPGQSGTVTVTQPGTTITQGGSTITIPGQTVTVTQTGPIITLPATTVTQPGQTITQGGSTVTQPAQTVTLPGTTITQTMPGQTVTQPGQTVTQPGESVTQPGQTVTQPGQTVTVTQPGTTITQPGTTITQGGSIVTQPAQTITIPGQTVTVTQTGPIITLPATTVTQPGQTVTQGGSTVTQPAQTITLPGTTITQTMPGQTVTQPGQTVTQPGESVTQPGPTVTQPGRPGETGGVGIPPNGQLPCPNMLPSCINTFLDSFGKKCKNNLDVNCYCSDPKFTQALYNCFYANRNTDDDFVKAQMFFQGMCARSIPQNPNIATGGQTITSIITVTGTPRYEPSDYTTVMVPATQVMSSQTIVVTSTLAVPQVVLPAKGPGAPTPVPETQKGPLPPSEAGSPPGGGNPGTGGESGGEGSNNSGPASPAQPVLGTGTEGLAMPTGAQGMPVTAGANRVGASFAAGLVLMAAVLAL